MLVPKLFQVELQYVDICGTKQFRIESMNPAFSYLSKKGKKSSQKCSKTVNMVYRWPLITKLIVSWYNTSHKSLRKIKLETSKDPYWNVILWCNSLTFILQGKFSKYFVFEYIAPLVRIVSLRIYFSLFIRVAFL